MSQRLDELARAPTLRRIGKYQVLRKIAAGGMAEVYLAKVEGPLGFEKIVVLKQILPHLAEDPAFVEMFLTEARLAARLNHPNVVQIFDFGESNGAYYLAMEYVDGPNLRTLHDRALKRDGRVKARIVAKIISLVCEGLAYAHEFRDPATGEAQGLIHRDMSPENILLSEAGAVKVADFGIAKAVGSEGKTGAGKIKGKIAYMAPEQIQTVELDRRTDVFALGIVLYELLAGVRPFKGETEFETMRAIVNDAPVPLAEQRGNVPAGLVRVVGRALKKNPSDRYQSCREMQADLDKFLQSTGEPLGGFHLSEEISNVTAAPPAEAIAPTLNQRAPWRPRALPRWALPAAAMVAAAALTFVFISKPKQSSSVVVTISPPPVAERPSAPSAIAPPSPPQPGEPVTPAAAAPPVAPAPPSTTRVASATRPSAPAAPSLIIDSQPAGQVRVNGRDYGRSPATVKGLSPGNVTVEVFDPAQHFSRTETVTLSLGAHTTQKIEISKGKVQFRVQPSATVFLDGKEIGQTPMASVDAWEGPHEVRLVNADLHKEVTLKVTVKAGDTSVIKHLFGQ